MDSRLGDFLVRADALLARLEPLLPVLRPQIDWQQSLAARWQREGRSGFLSPLRVSLDMQLSDLIGVDRQRAQLARNTHQFIQGLPANHALLWGARGTGKSSLVRALLALSLDGPLNNEQRQQRREHDGPQGCLRPAVRGRIPQRLPGGA